MLNVTHLIWLLTLINKHQEWNRVFEREWTKPNVSWLVFVFSHEFALEFQG